jgi:Molecular chaperone
MIYGIDFGTSNTVVSAISGGEHRVLSLGEEGEVVPSLMYFDFEGKLSVGARSRSDYAAALAESGRGRSMQRFRFFQALKFALRDPLFSGTKLFGRRWSIEQLVGAYLREIRVMAEEATGEAPELVVMGRPVALSPKPEEEALLSARFREACAIAGLGEVRFVLEPVAAMSDLARSFDGKALVFDFGGGTLDVTVAELSGGRARVLASAGQDLGGYLLNEDLSRARIIKHFGYGSRFRTMTGRSLEIPGWVTNQVASFYALPLADIVHTRAVVEDLLHEASDRRKLQGLIDLLDRNLAYDLFERIDECKIELSSRDEASVAFSVPPNVSFDERIARSDFELIVGRRVEAARELVMKALSQAGLAVDQVEKVVRVGGSSRVPAFARMLEELFPGRVSEGAVFTSISAGLIGAHEAGLSTF